MKTVDELRRQIANTRDMQSVVATMKTLAAANVRRYEAAADAMAAYNRTVEMSFHVLLRDRPSIAKRETHVGVELAGIDDLEAASTRVDSKASQYSTGAIIFGSDQGLCGQFNEQIVDYALQRISLEPNAKWRIIAVGSRASSRIAEAKRQIEAEFHLPATIDSMANLIQDLMPPVVAWRNAGVERIFVFHNNRTSVAAFAPQHHQLFPLSRRYLNHCRRLTWSSNSLPIHSAPWDDLFSAVIREYLFAGLFRSYAESRASENASRIASMHAAEKNIDRRLAELQQDFSHTRQAAITEELMDIVTGYEALTKQA